MRLATQLSDTLLFVPRGCRIDSVEVVLPLLIVPWRGEGELQHIMLAWWSKGELKSRLLPRRCRRRRRMLWCSSRLPLP